MSGISYNGGASRCWNSWQKFMDCYTAQQSDDPRVSCQLLAEDYNECLHHRKEIQRAAKISAEIERKQAKGEDLPQIQKQHGLKYQLKDLDFVK